jgi:SEC-C motif-containing protein
MRSRYSAFALRDEAYLLRTWHSSTRPTRLRTDPDTHWTGLEIVATAGGGALLPRGTVEFRASYRQRGPGGEAGVQRGNSRFVRENGQWYYLDEDPAG